MSALFFALGGVWGVINFYFIQQLLYGLLLESPKKPLKIAIHALIKFPILYSVGFGVFYTFSDYGLALLTGFSVGLIFKFWKVNRQKASGLIR